jgi:hypothetical protein
MEKQNLSEWLVIGKIKENKYIIKVLVTHKKKYLQNFYFGFCKRKCHAL